ncbi:DnaA ATPase domain-containing protein [Flammeovirga agarivorans]|nr:DnaA/Hda family protein [Flammeovirga agarivorans]
MKSLEDFYVHPSNEEFFEDFFTPYLDNLDQTVKRPVGIFLWGDNGTGKTHLMTSLLKEVYEKFPGDKRIMMISAQDIMTLKTANWGNTTDNVNFERFKRAHRCWHLLIEDLGKEYEDNQGISLQALDSLLRTRVQAGLVTHFTSNLSPENLHEKYSRDFKSLVLESTVQRRLRGKDYRVNISKENFEYFKRLKS